MENRTLEVVSMTTKEFDALPNYSASNPTATTPGKKWRRQERNGKWWLCEYVESNQPGYVCVKRKLICLDDGLRQKYKVEKTDGTPIDPEAQYFVLRIDTDAAARQAVLEYALRIEDQNPGLATELRNWVAKYPYTSYPLPA